jgi:hypothetical protein
MKKIITVLMTMTFSMGLNASTFNSHLSPSKGKADSNEVTCFPMSPMNFEVGSKSISGLSELDFNLILDRVENVMGPEMRKHLNKKLIFTRLWADPTVDAHTTRDDDNNPVIVVSGGLARHPQMTKDGFLLLMCHEIGHHLGGAPKIFRGNSNLRGWSSAEGQADYYATTKCLPKFFQSASEDKNIDYDVDVTNQTIAMSKCSDQLCARSVLAGLAVSQVFASLVKGTPEPSLLIQDPTKVEKTYYKHPNPQCRLDTYLSGANCDIGTEVPFDINNPSIGACLKEQNSRPLCWFQEKDFIKQE